MIERRTVRRAKPEGSREPDTCGGVFYVADSCRVAGQASPAGAAGDAEGISGNGDFRVKVADGTVVFETGAPGRFHAAVQIDSGAGLRARPLSCVSFDAGAQGQAAFLRVIRCGGPGRHYRHPVGHPCGERFRTGFGPNVLS